MSDHIFTRCTACNVRVERCLSPDNHRAQRKHVHCCDFLLGGVPPKGQRIRKQFKAGITKEEVKKYVYGMITDYERGTFIPKDKSKTLLSDVLDKYLNEYALEQNRNTVAAKHYIKVFKELFGGAWIGSLTLEQLETARSEYKEETGRTNASVNRAFAILKAVLNKAMQWGYIQRNPAQFLKPLPIKETVPRFLSIEELARLRAHIQDQRLKDFTTALLHTAIRPVDIKSLTWSQVDRENRCIHITTHKGRKPHNYSVPIDDTLWIVIQRRFKETNGLGPVFDTSNIRKLAEQAIKDSKINEDRSYGERFTIYGLKHTFISHLLMSGQDIGTVSELVGVSVSTLQKHYAHLTMEHLRKVQSKINLTPALTPDLKII